jgi:hypothetical protein
MHGNMNVKQVHLVILRQKVSLFIYVRGSDSHRDCGCDVRKRFVRGLQVVTFKLLN